MDSIQPNLLKSVSTTLPVVEVVDVLLAVAVSGVPPEDVEDGGAEGEQDEDGHAHADGNLHLLRMFYMMIKVDHCGLIRGFVDYDLGVLSILNANSSKFSPAPSELGRSSQIKVNKT